MQVTDGVLCHLAAPVLNNPDWPTSHEVLPSTSALQTLVANFRQEPGGAAGTGRAAPLLGFYPPVACVHHVETGVKHDMPLAALAVPLVTNSH
jgi:hypothetical protein